MEILKVGEKYSWILPNALKSNEWNKIWVLKTFKIEISIIWSPLQYLYRRGYQTILPCCRIGSLEEIRSPLFKFQKFEKCEKSTAELCRIHWNLMNDEEFWALKFLKSKYRMRDQTIQPFWKIGAFPSKKLVPSPL